MAKKNKVIVLGTGFIGASLLRHFAKVGIDAWGINSKNCDLTKPEALPEILKTIGSDFVVIFASAIGRAQNDSPQASETNVRMAVNVAEALRLTPCKQLVFFSSVDVFGSPKTLPIQENSTPNDLGNYGLSKVSSEQILTKALSDICPLTILRLTGVYGLGDGEKSVVGKIVHNAKTSKSLELNGTGKVKRDYLYIDDLCLIVEQVLANKIDGVFNVATGQSFSLKEIAETAIKAVGNDTVLAFNQKEDNRSFDLEFDNSKLLKALKGFAFTPMQTAIKSYCQNINEIICPVCKSQNYLEHNAYAEMHRITSDCRPWKKGGRLISCKDCGAIFKLFNQSFLDEASQIYAGYEIYAYSKGNEPKIFAPDGSMKSRSNVFIEQTFKNIDLPKTGKMLDMGCGNGASLRAFSEFRPEWQLVGADFNPEYREIIQSIPKVEYFISGGIEKVDECFDIIGLFHCLEHVENPCQFLTDLSQKLNPDGMILGTIPNVRDNPMDIMVADHATHFSPETLALTIANAGLEAVFLSDSVVHRELCFLAKRKDKNQTKPTIKNVAGAASDYLNFLSNMKWSARKQLLGKSYGIFGTGNNSTWLFIECDETAEFFVDENPDRIGNTFFNRPIFALKDVPKGSLIALSNLGEAATKISDRLSGQGLKVIHW